jgi:FkbM family methyltransferase
MNEQYAVRMIEAKDLVVDPAAADRLALLFDVIDFDTIRTVCEIGSRFLEQTLEMAHIFPDAHFHAFEPTPSSFQICLDNKEKQLSSVKNRISLYNLAVSNKTEQISFYEVDDTGSEHNVGASSKYRFVPGLNGSFFGKTWNQREIKVDAITLDEWAQQNNPGPIDLIWIDAQGSELDAFKGAEQVLKDVKVIFSEVGIATYYEGQSLKPDIDAYLASQGFKELEYGFKLNHPYEGDTIYIKA